MFKDNLCFINFINKRRIESYEYWTTSSKINYIFHRTVFFDISLFSSHIFFN